MSKPAPKKAAYKRKYTPLEVSPVQSFKVDLVAHQIERLLRKKIKELIGKEVSLFLISLHRGYPSYVIETPDGDICRNLKMPEAEIKNLLRRVKRAA